MKSNFHIQIENSSASRKSRDLNCELAFDNSENLMQLFNLAFDLENKNHFKACWILELVLEKDILLIVHYLSLFSDSISRYKNDSAIRSISKICLFISKSKQIELTIKQEQQIIETCIDWLIQNVKVATKVYAMRTLYQFSKKHLWIGKELKIILEQDYSLHSSAYKVAAREILKNINKQQIVN